MKIRNYRNEDAPALKAMLAAQRFDYELPDLTDPKSLFITRLVIEKDSKPVAAVLGRLTSEAYFLENPESGTDIERARRFLILHGRAIQMGREAGIDSIHVWLPPEVQKKFGPQLESLGWEQFTWPVYERRI